MHIGAVPRPHATVPLEHTTVRFHIGSVPARSGPVPFDMGPVRVRTGPVPFGFGAVPGRTGRGWSLNEVILPDTVEVSPQICGARLHTDRVPARNVAVPAGNLAVPASNVAVPDRNAAVPA